MKNNNFIFIICIILILFIIYNYYFNISNNLNNSWNKIIIQSGLGPMISVGNLSALLDTGSPYLFTTEQTESVCRKPKNSGMQEYYYAGPSANFKWNMLNMIVEDEKLGCITVGVVEPKSVSDFGLEAIVGLVPLPTWASQRFNQQSFVDELKLSSFSFDLRDQSSPKFAFNLPSHNPSDKLIANIPITPQISLPTPGLGFATTAITELDVKYENGDGYNIVRSTAKSSLPQSNEFIYTDSNEFSKNGKSEVLDMTEWFCLFDTGTFPAVFQAEATANLLGPRVTQSMISNQTTPNTYEYADVSYTFLDQNNKKVTLLASHTKIPKLNKSSFSGITELMTVCGFSLQLNYRIDYHIDREIGLPESVQFFQ